LTAADHHTIAKHAVKEIAWANGRAVTLPAEMEPQEGRLVVACAHVAVDGSTPAFRDENGEHGMSALMRHFMAGLIEYASEYTCFLAPYVNSYKRFMKGSFAPTRTVWSVDNRTAGFRLCGEGTKACGSSAASADPT
jgi:glutamine synthetase